MIKRLMAERGAGSATKKPSPIRTRKSQGPLAGDAARCYFSRMDTLTIQIPDTLLLKTGASREDLERESQFCLALHFFERGQLTSGQAASMCRMNRVDFLFSAGQEGVAVADLDGEELERELKAGGGR